MVFSIIVTVGPSLLANDDALRSIDALGDCWYRLNGAHVEPGALESIAAHLRHVLGSPRVVLDLPGIKIRMANLDGVMAFSRGSRYRIAAHHVNFPEVLAYVHPGDRMRADSGKLVLEVLSAGPEALEVVARSDGVLASRKGLHVAGAAARLPFLSERDRALIAAGIDARIDDLSLSYVRDGNDVRAVKALLPSGVQPIAKIETALALENLAGILDEVSIVNVDRGDLASEIGIMRLAAAQERVVRNAKDAGRQVFLATQFLGAMEQSPTPLIPEILDLDRTIRAGVSGIQLSEETAIGKYAVECVALVFAMYRHVVDAPRDDGSSSRTSVSLV